ncbi:serine/threonine/tyrosine-protein kinase HT1-like [Apium graveolens]|uniref:serine/threonine/tyrosine-protein kinase HT1-like n=1 Tax=Apium graveolens TaxID=4045 RepID=UPI003D79BB52
MGEESSWIRRTNYSHTIYHRLESGRLSVDSRLTSFPFTSQPDRIAGLKSRPAKGASVTQIQLNPKTNKPRAMSPHPETKLSDTFEEARSDQKRFSTPHPVRGGSGKVLHKDFVEKKAPNIKHHSKSFTNLSSMKFYDKSKSKKESAWAKFFDHGGGKVTSVESADEWMIDLSKLFIGLRFAHGAHSQLYHGAYKDEPVAVKMIRVPDDIYDGSLGAQLEKQFTREVTLLSRLHHQNVIKFLGACRKPPIFCIVTEYLSEGSLRAYMHKLEEKLSLQKVISLALDIGRGMEFVHSQGVIHRDLKPENILISQDFQLKIADFGIACRDTSFDSLADDTGTYRWMAPEMIKHKSYSRKVDVYGFGLILWEMVSGSIPYEDMTPIQAAFAVVNKNLRPAIPDNCPAAMKALIEQCWSSHPDRRPEFCQIVKVLEQFKASLASDGNLDSVQNLTSHDHKKGIFHLIHKLGPVHHTHHTHHTPPSTPKPRFA